MKHSDQASALRALREITKRLPGAEEYVMVHHPAFRVGKKPFAIAGMDTEVTVSLNLGPEAQGHLLSDDRFTKTHYIGRHGWVTVDFDALSAPELTALVTDSYRRIAGKKLLAQLDGAPAAAPRTKATSRAAASGSKTKTAKAKPRRARKA